MDRRTFLAAAAAPIAAPGLAAPAIAQSSPPIKWRLTSSFPRSLDTIFGAADVFSKAVAAATDGRFLVDVFAPGELVPGLAALDAVSAGTVECAHTSSFLYVGKNEAFAFGTALPFGLNARQQNAWMLEGGGLALTNAFYAKFGVLGLPMGNTGAQMGGWYRRELNAVADLKGLKIRIAGLAGEVLARLGAVPQQIAGGDIYPALERGSLDAVEWSGPYDDEKLGFHRVAKYYYYPSWWEGGPMIHLFVGLPAWNGLPPAYQAAIRLAAAEANQVMLARYDARNPPALRRLAAAGAVLKRFPTAILDTCYDTAFRLYDEIAARNPDFRAIYEPWKAFRAQEDLWFQFAEFGFDEYVYTRANRG
jgi:TRAP-type mannitol/chloroaromatic compound transport system substrate-binding protein